jgi:glucose uptake protein
MILPQTYAASLLVLIISLLCLGSWANTYKLARKLRYELYYADWIIGAFACMLILALTVGSLGFDGFSLVDDLMIAARKAWFFAFVAGALFGLGNALLLASVSLAGLAIAFPIAMAVALCLSTPIDYFVNHDRPTTFLILGCCLPVAAAGIAIWLNRAHVNIQHEAIARAGKAKSTRRPSAAKPVILAIIGGLLIGGAAPLVDLAQVGEIGLGPYSSSFLYTFGAALAGLLATLFLMNLPIQGEPVEILDYFRDGWLKHLFGLAGGALWSVGLAASLVPMAAALAPNIRAGMPVTFGLTQSAPVLAAAWGIVAWKEIRGGDPRMAVLAGLMLLLFEGGVLVLALAPIYAAP